MGTQKQSNRSWQRALSLVSLGMIFTGLLAITACKKSSDDNQPGGTIAATPCTATCNGTIYTGVPGLAAPTAYTYGLNSGFCGCAYGTRPIYHPEWGFACVQANTIAYSAYLGYNSSTIYQAQNVAALNMQQINYSPVQYGSENNCFSSVAASCDVRAAGSCTNGGFCRPIGGGSSVGVCTTGAGVDSYNSGNPAVTPYSNSPYSNNYMANPYYGGGYYAGAAFGVGAYGTGPQYGTGYGSASPYAPPYTSGNGAFGNNCSYRSTSWGGTTYGCSYGNNNSAYPTGSGIPR